MGADGRIAIVTPAVAGTAEGDDIDIACSHYARTLADAGHRVEIVFATEVGRQTQDYWAACCAGRSITLVNPGGIEPSAVPIHGARWYTERALGVLELLRARDYDYIIFQDWQANGFWSVRARAMGVAFGRTPVAVIAHAPNQWQNAALRTFGSSPLEEGGLNWAEKQQIADADCLISPSRYMVQWLRECGYALPDEVAICPYTFEGQVSPGRPEAVDRSHLIYYGRLDARGGLHLLGGALRRLKETGDWLPATVSVLARPAAAGPSPEDLDALKAALAPVEFHIDTDVDRDRAADYIRRANGVVVIPSAFENCPLAVIDAITGGACFIAAEAGGIPEMVDPRVCFPATVQGLERKLSQLDAIDFGQLRHGYDPAAARAVWLAHVDERVAQARSRPPAPVQVLREALPPISVCMPFYRHDRYIERVIGSFLRMGLPQLQLVVVNDGTPAAERPHFDRLKAELEPYGHVFHSQANGGAGVARNTAASLARNELLLNFDADNVPFSDMVERLWGAMEHSRADIVAAPFVAMEPMARRPTLADATLARYQPQGGPVMLGLIDNVLADTCALVRRNVFDALGGFVEQRESLEDWDFFLRAVAAGFRHLVHPDPLFYYTMDGRGRLHQQIREYENRSNLLSRLDQMPMGVAAETARTLILEFLVSHRYV